MLTNEEFAALAKMQTDGDNVARREVPILHARNRATAARVGHAEFVRRLDRTLGPAGSDVRRQIEADLRGGMPIQVQYAAQLAVMHALEDAS